MFGFLKKILGSKSDKDLKEIYPLVDKINTEFDKLKGISDEDLRGKTESFKLKIKESLKETDDEIKSLKNKYEVSEGSLDEKEEILNSIDKILEDQNKTIENVLNEIKLEEKFNQMWNENGINGLKGHRSVGGYRASMYNAMSLESVNVLVEVMNELEKKA